MSYPNDKEELVKLYKKRLEENLDMEAKNERYTKRER